MSTFDIVIIVVGGLVAIGCLVRMLQLSREIGYHQATARHHAVMARGWGQLKETMIAESRYEFTVQDIVDAFDWDAVEDRNRPAGRVAVPPGEGPGVADVRLPGPPAGRT